MTARACQHHPEEAAVGICVRCSAPLCDACITKLDGINHCRSCLLLRAVLPEPESAPNQSGQPAAASGAQTEPRPAAGWLTLAMAVALLALLALSTLNAVLPLRAP